MPRRALPLRRAVSVRPAVEEMAAVCDDTYVSEYMTVEERGTVQHLTSRVVGRLRPGLGPWHAFAALFPAVTAALVLRSVYEA